MDGCLAAFTLVFCAEMGDKTQLIVMAFTARYSWKPVMAAVLAATLATILSVVFDQKKKKLRGSKKYRNFPQRMIKNYKLADSILGKTLTKDLDEKAQHFKDKKLEEMTIENGEFIDI